MTQHRIKYLIANHRQQNGAAMLIVLLITALASVVALSITERLALDIARTETLQQGVRGNELSVGLEALASKLLEQAQNSEPFDHSESLWNNPLPGLPVPGGVVTGSVQSLDGRFNVNTLLTKEGVPDTEVLAQCERLLTALGLPISIADALMDWQDIDSSPRSQGAEDAVYTQRQPPYLAANRAFTHISELRLVAGINADVYQRLLPHMTVLPVNDSSRVDFGRRINVNLASIAVLQSLIPGITRQQAEVLHQQGLARFQATNDFLSDMAFANLNTAQRGLLESRISVSSQFFLARADVVLANKPRRYFALLQRVGNSYDVRYRSFATP